MTNYDSTTLPAGYDRARDHGPENLALWMRAVAAHLRGRSVSRILDLGCGTGRFSEGLAAHFDAEVVGLDPSAKMLDVARNKLHDDRVRYCRGRAEALPIASSGIDLVFMSMSYHHFSEPLAAARECRRVLRRGGSAILRTGTRELIEEYPYVPFFRAILPILHDMLPDHRELRQTFGDAGLDTVSSEVIRQTIAPDWRAYVPKLEAGADSALARLSRDDYDAGIDAVRRFSEQGEHGPVIEAIDLFVFRPTAGQ